MLEIQEPFYAEIKKQFVLQRITSQTGTEISVKSHGNFRVDELARIEEAGGEVIYRGNCFRVQGDLVFDLLHK